MPLGGLNEDILNIYLKNVGITSQREIEHAVLKAVESGKLNGSETLEIKMTLGASTIASRRKLRSNK